ncbi:hypothetical protein H8959_022313 [Pygathrix nigripes]
MQSAAPLRPLSPGKGTTQLCSVSGCHAVPSTSRARPVCPGKGTTELCSVSSCLDEAQEDGLWWSRRTWGNKTHSGHPAPKAVLFLRRLGSQAERGCAVRVPALRAPLAGSAPVGGGARLMAADPSLNLCLVPPPRAPATELLPPRETVPSLKERPDCLLQQRLHLAPQQDRTRVPSPDPRSTRHPGRVVAAVSAGQGVPTRAGSRFA